MALYKDTKGVITTPTTEVAPAIIDTASVYVNNEAPIISTMYIEGTRWSVNYFGQFINATDTVSNSGDTTSRVLKEYQQISNMELRVDTELSHSTDTATGLTTITGSANVYPILVPIVGDLFVAEVEPGIRGIFEVVAVTKMSLYKEAAWSIEYTMISYLNDYNLPNLLQKVVVNLIFDPSLLGTNQGPLVTISENDRNITKEEMLLDLVDRYYDEFFNTALDTVISPYNLTNSYDPFVIEFWNKYVPDRLLNNRTRLKLYDIKTSIFRKGFHTVYDAIADRSSTVLERSSREMGYVSVTAFGSDYIYHSLLASGLSRIVHPTNVNGEVIGASGVGTYIFTDNFYDGITVDMTPFELLVYKFINKETLPTRSVMAIYDTFSAYPDIYRFNITPILITLLEASR